MNSFISITCACRIRSIENLSKEDLVLLRIADCQKGFCNKSGEKVVVVGGENSAPFIGVASELQSTLTKVGNILKLKSWTTR
jgi:hypothetical protein